MDKHLTWKPQIQQAVAKAKLGAYQLSRLSKQKHGLPARQILKLYYGAVIPRALYGAEIWLTPAHGGGKNEKGKTKPRKGSIAAIKALARAQRTVAIAAAGALRTSPADAVEAHMNMLPMELLVNKVCHRAMVRLTTLPETHPLTKYVRRCGKRYVQRHRTPIHTLSHLYQLRHEDVETIKPVATPPWANINIKSIVLPREDAIQFDEENQAHVRVYTDGSGYKNGAGASAVMYHHNRNPKSLIYHLGTLSQHTVHEGETIGLTLAGHLLAKAFKERRTYDATISVDNTSAIQGARNRTVKASQATLLHFRQQLDNICKSTRKKISITLLWVPGHEGVEGNEEADQLAKRAAEGNSSNKEDLPRFLHKPLRANIAALKQAHAEKLKIQQRKIWQTSKRRRAQDRLKLRIPSDSFTKITKSMKRRQAALLIQLRLGHIPLNKYLHRIGKIDRASCPACGAAEETVQHYIADCPKYARERWKLARLAGQRELMSFALSTKEGAGATMEYIKATERFERRAEVNSGGKSGAIQLLEQWEEDESGEEG